jgi:hypothetical protein
MSKRGSRPKSVAYEKNSLSVVSTSFSTMARSFSRGDAASHASKRFATTTTWLSGKEGSALEYPA